ncbi:hypothetical protein P3X46_030744 [Hevea brasiliensis]|uniref:Pectinesterase n=1 Tax=Hevea brasiliensis TaxID=3981 RepID=A0ABQ9KJZ6_HEVBR|nr:hypothetical protein P3X46_030744 [Hevea brasiliensis]
MAKQLSFIALAQYTILAIVLAATTVSADDATPIPDTPDGIQAWFDAYVKPISDHESTPKTINVRQDGSGEFKTITDAVKSIPKGNKERVIKVTIEVDKPFITFLGPPEKATLAFGGTAAEYGTVYSATLQVDSDFFVASNLIIQNTAPRPEGTRAGQQAVALTIGGTMAAFYNVKMLGFQDTLCDYKGFHFFKDCYIEGTVDFIFGRGKSIYLQTEIRVLADQDQTIVTAQARETETQDVGFSFVHCSITGKGTGAFLGRAWMPMPRVVFAYTSMVEVINPEGWSNNHHPEREAKVFFGEYKNTGPGAAPAERVKFAKQLTEEEVKPFLSLGFIKGTSWLLPPPKA